MVSITNNELWKEFFERLHSLPAIWRVGSDIYKNKSSKAQAWEDLLLKYKEIDPCANVDTLKKRVNNIKTVFRRELRKVRRSLRSGNSSDTEYVPNLWYFDALFFLKDQDLQTSTISDSDEEMPAWPKYEVINEEYQEADPIETSARKRPKLPKPQTDDRDIFLKTAIEQLRNITQVDPNPVVRDDADVFAEGWACLYRKLSHNQQVFAKKLVDEVLMFGQLERLSLDTTIITLVGDQSANYRNKSWTTNNYNNPHELSDPV